MSELVETVAGLDRPSASGEMRRYRKEFSRRLWVLRFPEHRLAFALLDQRENPFAKPTVRRAKWVASSLHQDHSLSYGEEGRALTDIVLRAASLDVCSTPTRRELRDVIEAGVSRVIARSDVCS